MSSISVNTITDSSGGSTTSINGFTPSVSNMAGRNRIINGDMRIDQRNAGAGVAVTSAGYTFGVDRFSARASIGSGHTLSQETDAPDGFSNSLKFTVGTGATPTGTDFVRCLYLFEGYDVANLNYGSNTAKTVTLSFWVKSSLTGTFGVALRHFTSRNSVAAYTISQANTWEHVSVSFAGDVSNAFSDTTNLEALTIGFDLGEGPDRSRSAGSWLDNANTQFGLTNGTKVIATSGATWQITGVQLEEGSVATPFEHRHYGQELALCQRYYEVNPTTQKVFAVYPGGSTVSVGYSYLWKVTKRASPTVTTGEVLPSTFVGTSDEHGAYWIRSGSVTAYRVTGPITADSEL